MLNSAKYIITAMAVLAASSSAALATPLPPELPTSLPFGIIGIAVAGVIGGVWLARKKR